MLLLRITVLEFLALLQHSIALYCVLPVELYSMNWYQYILLEIYDTNWLASNIHLLSSKKCFLSNQVGAGMNCRALFGGNGRFSSNFNAFFFHTNISINNTTCINICYYIQHVYIYYIKKEIERPRKDCESYSIFRMQE